MALRYTLPTTGTMIAAAPAGLVPPAISAENLIVDYRYFEDATEPYADASGNGYPGSLVNGGPAIRANPEYSRTSGAFTAIMVLRASTMPDSAYLVRSESAAVGVNLYATASGSGFTGLSVQYNHSGGTNLVDPVADPSLAASAYAQIALVWDGVDSTSGVVSVYVNGALLGAVNLAGALTTPPDGATGNHGLQWFDDDFGGDWQWLSFYDREFSAGQIAADYTARQEILALEGITI